MKPIQRLGGMASLLLLVSLFSPAKATAAELSPQSDTQASIADRIDAIHNKLEEAEQQLPTGQNASKEMNDLIAQWYDWGDWGDWGDWVDWGDWSDWVDWGDWSDWGNWSDWADWGDWVDWGDWYNY